MVRTLSVHFAKGHDLNEGQVHAIAMRPADQAFKFGLVDALQRYGIDLDGQTSLLRCSYAVKDLVQITPARHRAEFVRV